MNAPPATAKNPEPKQPADVEQSVAGEEDPGAALDIGERAPAKSDQVPKSSGDEVPPGTPGTDEDIRPDGGA
ncbi:MAG: hypothetical protein ACXWJM_17935 [Ramlibacter sp.]